MMTSLSALTEASSQALRTSVPGDPAFSPDRVAPPFVSVVVPCRNESRYIARCLDSILANDFDPARLEILVVDGASDDGTRGVVAEYAARDSRVRLLDNPRRITPTALNIGIRAARGDVIIRMDAHNAYPTTYVSSLVDWLVRSGADNVGGIWITRPAGDSSIQKAIAVGLSHPFGVGNSYFRIGSAEPRWVDNVPFGCYRRDVFERIGLFDEELVRNQDEELNLRLVRDGGRILLVPSIVSHYSARGSLDKLARMNFQYGYFKPLVIRKIGAVMTVRQVVPATFVATLVASAILAPLNAVAAAVFVAVASLYLGASILVAAGAWRSVGFRPAAALVAVFPVIHVAYGVGFLGGVMNFLLRRRAVNALSVPITR